MFANWSLSKVDKNRGRVYWRSYWKLKSCFNFLSSLPLSASCTFFALASIFARPKSEKGFKNIPTETLATQAACRSIIDFRIERQNKPANTKPPKRKTSLPSVDLALLKLDINYVRWGLKRFCLFLSHSFWSWIVKMSLIWVRGREAGLNEKREMKTGRMPKTLTLLTSQTNNLKRYWKGTYMFHWQLAKVEDFDLYLPLLKQSEKTSAPFNIFNKILSLEGKSCMQLS